MAYLTEEQVLTLGFKSIGKNVKISDKASFYNCKNISIGNNVRIDDFCVISAGHEGMVIGNYVHIAVFCSLIGSALIKLEDFSGLSSRVSVYSSSDDYSGTYLTNPMVPNELANVLSAQVVIGKHVIIGSGSVVLPGVILEEGVAIGALSLVNNSCKEYGIYSGVPVRRIKDRGRGVKELELKVYGS